MTLVRAEVAAEVIEHVLARAREEVPAVHPGTTLESLALESMEVTLILIELEDRTGFVLPEGELEKLELVRDIERAAGP